MNKFGEDLKNDTTNICQYGFMFESALCMLNLDGDEDTDVYDIISDRHIKLTCKRWDQFNQSLLAVNVPLDYGTTIRIPLFKKISPKKNKEFTKDASKIPEGAIIVTESNNKHGHVEVKTNQNTCGKDGTQSCFCSDHCRARSRYNHRVLAVFVWNPDFIGYVSTNYY